MSEVVDPQVRANLGLRIMLRVTSNEMVKVCLGDGQHEDITADSISYDERGGCWVAGLGSRAVRARGFFVATSEGRDRAIETADMRWPLEDVFRGQGITDANTLNTESVAVVTEASAGTEPEAEERPQPTDTPAPASSAASVSLLTGWTGS